MSFRLVAPALLVSILAPVSAFAAPCSALPGGDTVPAGFVLKPGAEVFGVEGPISALDTVNRTVVVAGSCINIPVGVLVDNNGDGVGDIELASLVSPTGRPPEGGTMIIDGDVTVDAGGHLVLTATLPFFEFGEHVFVGPLVSVDAAAGTFKAGHTTVTMNTDARVPSDLLDLNGDQIEVADLLGWEGTVVSAQGYMQDGQLHGTFVETEVIPTVVGVDSVAVERADHRTSKRSVDIRGQVTAQEGTGAFTGRVHIDIGCNSKDAAGNPILSGSPGASIENVAVVTVDPVLNLGDWRWISGNNAVAAGSITNATTVCVYSDLGGQSAPRNFTIRN